MYQATGEHPDRARRWQVLSLFAIVGMILSAFSYVPVQRVTPTADAAVGGIYTVSTDGAARHMYVAEYQGLLYTLWTDFSGDPNWQLRLSQSQNSEGTSWNYPQNVNNKGAQKPDFPKIKLMASADGRLHAVWSDAANQGAVYHAWFTPGNGKNPADPNQWEYSTVSGSGKAAAFDIDADGNVYVVWDTTDTVWGRIWYANTGSYGGTVNLRGSARLPGIAVTNDRIHLIFVDTGTSSAYYKALDKGWGSVGETDQLLASGKATDPSPEIVKDANGAVYMAWSMDIGNGLWEIRVRQRLAGQGLGAVERASHNYSCDGCPDSGSNFNHSSPTIAVDNSGTVWVAWTGAESGNSQIYERSRPAGSSFGDYGSAGQFCVSCNGTGIAGQAEYGSSITGAIHLVWGQKDSGGNYRVMYSLREASGPGASPSPSPNSNPPVISNVGQQSNTLTSTTVTWNTDTNSSSRVFFSTVGVDTTCTAASCTAGDPTLVTQHGVTLRNLSPNTTYNYQVRSTDAFGQVTLDSQVRTFKTPSFEIVGNGKTADGKFSGLVYVPAGTQQLDWIADNNDPVHIQWTVTSKPGVVAFAGALPTGSVSAPHTFAVYVRYNGQGSQITNVASIQWNPAFKATFSDVDPNSTTPEAVAIYALEGRGIVQGSNGLFRPTDPIARAEAAAIVARMLTWINEQGSAHFTDQGTVDSELWNDVNILADYSVALGFGDGTYQPTTSIAQGQIISLVTRAMVAKGYWQDQNDDGSFPQIPPGSGHRVDVITFNFYTNGALATYFSGGNYASPADRRFVARIAYDAVKWREGLATGTTIYELP